MSSSEKRGPGRPPMHEEAADKLMRVRVTPGQFERYESAAGTRDESLSQWVRRNLDRIARADLKRRG